MGTPKTSGGLAGAGEEVVSVDSNGDGKPDVFKFYPKGKVPADPNKPDVGSGLLRKEADLNTDGKIDVWAWYNADGTKLREAFDLDYDSKVDLIVFYEKQQVIRKEIYTAGCERPSAFKYYEKGKLARVERDRKCSGRIDTWEYWDGDHVDRVGEDNDGDGNVDRWLKPGKKS
jgi:antitoxin component YwqK of YwqJK toxin-antitoxin module